VDNRVLLTCPSRGRPELLEKMLNSFLKTRAFDRTNIIICLDDDDPMLNKYNDILYKKHLYYIRKRENVAQIHNFIFTENDQYDYYMPVNDDIEFISKDWDEILIENIKKRGDGWGISYGNDSTGNIKFELPTFGMISGNICRELGYIYPRELKMMFGDTFLLDLGRAIGKLFYCPDVILKHSKPGNVIDDHRLGSHFYKTEQLSYGEYINKYLDADVKKIFNAIVSSKLQEVS
jgi:hypothetical protein